MNAIAVPLVKDDQYTTPFGTTLTSNVLANDIGTNLLSVISYTQPSNGKVVLSPNGAFQYLPGPTFSGVDGFRYVAKDQTGNAMGFVTITVLDGIPNVLNDALTVVAGQSGGGNVLVNDSDPNGDVLTVIANSVPAHGAAIVAPNGAFTYTPGAGFSGPDSFSYAVTDGRGANVTATVNITVLPVANDDSVNVLPGQTAAGDVLSNDLGNVVAVTLVVPAQHGDLTLDPDGHFTYAANAGFVGPDGFDYRITDGGGSTATAHVSITVLNGSPNVMNDVLSILAGQSGGGNVLANDSDPNGDVLTVFANTVPKHGSASVASTGEFTYTPVAGFSGLDSFDYAATDGHGANVSATVNVTVRPLANDDSFTTGFEQPLTGNVLSNDVGNVVAVTLVVPAQHGNVMLAPDGDFTYVPNPGFAGPDGFDYQIIDAGGSNAIAHVTLAIGAALPVPALDPGLTGVLAGLLAWLGVRGRRRDS